MAYMFTLAVYPQFMLPQYGPAWLQAIPKGLITIATQGTIYGGLALAAAKSRDFLTDHHAVTIWTGRIAVALLLVVVAITLGRVFLEP